MLRLNQSVGQGYINNSQKARVVTEAWISMHMYCPACGNKQLAHDEARKPLSATFKQKRANLHPENKHICPKIRQQLRILRDRGIIEFTSPGKYRKISI